MKIYILPIDSLLQPQKKRTRIYPPHNDDYGVEQDFYKFLSNNPDLITNNLGEADWHYLPVYWTRWHINHNYAQEGLPELQKQVKQAILDPGKTFTICQYDDGPIVDIGESLVFLSSRKTQYGADIPLLCSPHSVPNKMPLKTYLASFIGAFKTHEIRSNLAHQLKSRTDIYISSSRVSSMVFANNILGSYIALTPRGYGGSSFRFFEAMQ